MYLVLTAMLALNVSAEILNAFKAIDDSLADTRETTNLAIVFPRESAQRDPRHGR